MSDSEEVSNGDLSDSGSSNDAPSDICTSEECVVGACTFVAERRAHKRGCLSYKSVHTLFPPPNSLGASAVPGALEPEPAQNRSLTPSSSKEVKPRMKVGIMPASTVERWAGFTFPVALWESLVDGISSTAQTVF